MSGRIPPASTTPVASSITPPGDYGRAPAGIRADAMGDSWMTYAAAAASLGMTTESVRQRARREHWRKQLGNDGKALILVPADTTRNAADDAPGDAADEAPASRPVKRPEPDTAFQLLQARISELESRAAELRTDVERERSERIAERDRAEKLVGEVATLARELARVAEEAGVRERDLLGRAGAAEAELAAYRSRPWWRRLMN